MFNLDEGGIGFLHRDLYYDEQFQALNLGYAKIIFYRMSKTSGPYVKVKVVDVSLNLGGFGETRARELAIVVPTDCPTISCSWFVGPKDIEERYVSA